MDSPKKSKSEQLQAIRKPPAIREVYWCQYPQVEHVHLPEFHAKPPDNRPRPVVVLSKKPEVWDQPLKGVVTVVPLTTSEQTKRQDRHYSVRIKSPIKEQSDSWAICNHITTVAVTRLIPADTPNPKVCYDDFQKIVKQVLKNLPDPEHREPKKSP